MPYDLMYFFFLQRMLSEFRGGGLAQPRGCGKEGLERVLVLEQAKRGLGERPQGLWPPLDTEHGRCLLWLLRDGVLFPGCPW